MIEWLRDLPIWWMASAVFAIVYLTAGGTLAIIVVLARGERLRFFKSISPALLSPLGTIFGLLVVFSVVQAWSDINRGKVAVDREASSIRMVVLLATTFPKDQQSQICDLVRRHIDNAISSEWPAMAKQSATLNVAPLALSEALGLALSLTPASEGQITAQREIVTELESAMDARRQRIILSGSNVNWITWTCLLAQAGCTLVAIAMVHSDNPASATVAMGIFATGVAVSIVLIASHDRPFSGEISVKPDVLLQVRPQ
jgi:hypothetical protein